MLIEFFRIDISAVRKRNQELLNHKLMSKLQDEEQNIILFYKMPRQYMNKDGLYSYRDLSNFLISRQQFDTVYLSEIPKFVILFQIRRLHTLFDITNVDSILRLYVHDIQQIRAKAAIKYINMLDTIINKGINTNDIVYRVMNSPFESNIIETVTSWSLIPIDAFLVDIESHIYVTKLPSDMTTFYMETDTNDVFSYYEYEFILPRNIVFKTLNTRLYKMRNPRFDNKDPSVKSTIDVYVHRIEIVEQMVAAKLSYEPGKILIIA